MKKNYGKVNLCHKIKTGPLNKKKRKEFIFNVGLSSGLIFSFENYSSLLFHLLFKYYFCKCRAAINTKI